MAKRKPGAGRPTKYHPKLHPKLAYAYLSHGNTIQDLATYLDLCQDTVNRWKNKYKDFRDAVEKATNEKNKLVESALFKRAIGAKVMRERAVTVSDGKDMGSHVEMVEEQLEHPPDTKACEFWLKNKDHKNWTDKREVDLTITDIDIGMPPTEFPDEILEDRE